MKLNCSQATNYLAGYGSSPDNPNSASQKDLNAFRAFKLAGNLIGPLLKWAINHEAGKILAAIDSYVEWSPHILKKEKLATEVAARNIAANSHQNERNGSKYQGDKPEIDQKLVAIILSPLAAGMKLKSATTVALALSALDQGEVLPALKSNPSGRKGDAVMSDALRLKAIMHVKFRLALESKNSAMDSVSNAFDISTETLRLWEKGGLPSIDQVIFKQVGQTAKDMGILYVALTNNAKRRKARAIAPMLDFDALAVQLRIKTIAEKFSDDQMVSDGLEYRRQRGS